MTFIFHKTGVVKHSLSHLKSYYYKKRGVGKDTGTVEMKGKWDLIRKSESRKCQSEADLKKQKNEIGSS